jgi:lysyl-tRNA synthetase class I
MKLLGSRGPVILLIGLLLGGCVSFEASVDRGRSLRTVQRCFVVSNPNDNHALDRQIATALTNRGRTAVIGPLTMLPDDAQAVVTYVDHWSWDFGAHLDYLKITVRDPLASQPYASVTFSARVSLREETAATVDKLIGTLLGK